MNTHSSRFEVAVTEEDEPGGSPLLGATMHWMGSHGIQTSEALILLRRGDTLLVMADGCPSRGSVAALRLSWPLPRGWATVVVTRARRTRFGPWELRLRLIGPPSPAFRMLRRDDPERH